MHVAGDRNKAIIVFGEVLFDCFPDGRRVLGGAPFNVAWSLCGFGCQPLFVSAVGEDNDGRYIRDRMLQHGMDCSGLQVNGDKATGEVVVSIQNDEPSYEICEDRAWDFIEDEDLCATEIIYHGLLALRNEASHQTLRHMVERSPAIRFFDINLRPPFVDMEVLMERIRGTDWLKLNLDELRTITRERRINLENCGDCLVNLRESLDVRNVLLTAGGDGAILHGEYGEAAISPAPVPEAFVDTVGAGDSFSAAAIRGIMKNMPAQDILTSAGSFASRVCGLRGATTANRDFYQNI
jgi:fructokinase